MLNLTPQTILQRISELRIQVDSSNNLKIFMRYGVVHCGEHGLAIIDAFYEPRSLSEVLESMRPHIIGMQDWINLTNTIVKLYQAGILCDTQHMEPTLGSTESGYDAAPAHISMLNDRARTGHLLEGIREVVRPGDVVVDIGTGVGVLAIAAAQAGARHVYAIEASSIGKLAEATFHSNGLSNRITLLQGWSTRLELPERADVLVSEMVGNDPTADYVLEILMDARKRLLKPHARLVPSRVRVFGLPVTIPRSELVQRTFTPEVVQQWRAWYGINFTPLAETASTTSHLFSVKPYMVRDWPTLSPPILLEDIDLGAVKELQVDKTVHCVAEKSGLLNGVLLYFEEDLGAVTRFSTHPEELPSDSFRRNPVWTLETPLNVQIGDKFSMNYTYRVPGVQNMIRLL